MLQNFVYYCCGSRGNKKETIIEKRKKNYGDLHGRNFVYHPVGKKSPSLEGIHEGRKRLVVPYSNPQVGSFAEWPAYKLLDSYRSDEDELS